jgi:hypothetical protein
LLAQAVACGSEVLEGPIVQWTNKEIKELKAELQSSLKRDV